jgi:microcystin-dependent protein
VASRVTQQVVEVLSVPVTSARVTQQVVEVLSTEATAPVGATQPHVQVIS